MIEKVLSDMRTAIKCKKCIPINRKKNMDTLAQLGITWKDAFIEIYSLSQNDYFSGPSVDRDYPNSDLLWVFKKYIDGHNIYIKTKVEYQQNGEVKIISFHIDYI
jgi:hypothetical protein